MSQAEKTMEPEAPEARFDRVVVQPLERAGMRKPRAFTAVQWSEVLTEVGRDFGGYSVVELEVVRKALRDRGEGRRGRTWPREIELRRLIREALDARTKATGSNSQIDQMMIEGALRWWRERGAPPPPQLYKLNRRNRLVAILGAENGPSVRELIQAGHEVPADLQALYGEGRGA